MKERSNNSPDILDHEEIGLRTAEFHSGDELDLHMTSGEHIAPYGTPEEAERRRVLAQGALNRNTAPRIERSPESERLGQIGLTLVKLREAARQQDFDLAA